MKQSIQSYLGLPDTWKIKENMRHEILLIPSKADVANARQKDPKGCALRNAACRIFGVPNAAIGGRWAYIPQRDDKGRMYIARMQASGPTQRAIKQFDEKGVLPIAGFHFIPVTKNQSSHEHKLYMRKYHAGKVGHNSPRRKKYTKRLRTTRTIPMNVRTSA